MTVAATAPDLLRAAIAAQERNDPERAGDLFRQHLRLARNDVPGLGHYGMFCVRSGQAVAGCYFLSKASRLSPGDHELSVQVGYAQIRNGDHDSAQRAFESVLAKNPNDPLALNGLGLCHAHAGRLAEARDVFLRAVNRQPDNLSILINLGDAQRRVGDDAAALQVYANARVLAPRHPTILLETARCLLAAGFPERAIEALSALTDADSKQPEALLELARCRRHRGQLREAVQLLSELNRLIPESAQFHEELGNCLTAPGERALRHAHLRTAGALRIEAGEFSRADQLFDLLLAEDPLDASTWNLRGTSQEAQQQLGPAEASFAKAIEIDRHFLHAYPNLGTLLEETNRVAEARKVADAGLQLGSDFPGFSLTAQCELRMVSAKVARRQKRFDAALAELDAMSELDLSEKLLEFVGFERGMVLDQLDRPAEAMAAFAQANASVRHRWAQAFPGPNEFLAEVVAMTEYVKRNGLTFATLPDPVRPHRDPMFLIGFPRSGTTLLNQIIDSNSSIQTLEEKPAVTLMHGLTAAMPEGYPDAIAAFDAIDVDYLRQAYFHEIGKHLALDHSKVFVDKFPFHIAKVGLIHRVFPQARFIFSARHPCDVILSCFMQNFRPNHAMANFFTLADAVTLYVRTMELWQLYQDKLPIKVHTVRYDAMVDDVEGESRKVCDFIGVPWQADQLDFAEQALRRGKINTPSYAQVSQPIYRGALGRWEKYREFFEPHLPALQPYIDKYG